MKKILIVNNNMHIGGVQKALVSLLWSIRGKYDITLLLFSKSGECLQEIPSDVKVITPESAYRYLGMTKYDMRSVGDKLGRAFFGAIVRLLGRKYAVALMAARQKRLEGYDVAISYLHNGGEKAFYGGCNDFVLNHVTADRKVAFIHCDYMLCGANTAENARQYGMFDEIVACSRGCADSFLRANPSLRDKVKVAYNCHMFEQICAKAQASPVHTDESKINIVTVARLGKEKGVERAMRAISGLGPLKENIHYYVIGDGIHMPLLLQIIKERELSQCVTLCGMLSNPYGYIRAADLLLIPSYSEAAPLVIGEAASLGTPILSTETSSAREMIEECGYGWVCENSEDAMTEMLKKLINTPSQLSACREHLAESVINNELAVSMFDQCMELD